MMPVIHEDPTKKNYGKKVKTCEECFETYFAGEGETEKGGETERFCSMMCADRYEMEIGGQTDE